MPEIDDACERAVQWLLQRVIESARGDRLQQLDVQPEGRFWLGRLASQAAVMNSPFGDRSERIEPCAIGIRVRPAVPPPWEMTVEISGCAWIRTRADGGASWTKTPTIRERMTIEIASGALATHEFRPTSFQNDLRAAVNEDVLRAAVIVDVERGREGNSELLISFLNDSPEAQNTPLADTGIYEARLRVDGLATQPFLLESLPDSFRYDRRIPAYGINCGVRVTEPDVFESTDVVAVDRRRPTYWTVEQPEPDLRFATLAEAPLPSLRALVSAHTDWGATRWSSGALDRRAAHDHWSPAMRSEAGEEAGRFEQERARLQAGIALLENDTDLRRSFQMMNEAISFSSRGRYASWRPFQIGFLLANLSSIRSDAEDRSVADILWFPTGGGKTETYLGLLVMAAFYDRMTGKEVGITAWSRFPLRLLSLQQTQRFADAIAGAEIVRRNHGIGGDPFSLGFFVGETSTPNRIKSDPGPGEPDSLDENMPAKFQVLLRCPFCEGNLEMGFSRRYWRLEHRCPNASCPWPEPALPIFVIDDEIYRFLPTIVVGTLDKVASISMQAAMRGFVASPYGRCSEEGHGFVYPPRSTRPNGCLVPGCRGRRTPLSIAANRFAPTFRLQDELHLLRDSLGAIDSHYESLLDRVEQETSGVNPKIVASSATLSGYLRQCEVLYRRRGRVFPLQGPTISDSFWTGQSTALLRRYIALAPRGATLEFAADRILTDLQQSIRRLLADPAAVCREIGINSRYAQDIVSLYGLNVVYGNTIRDIEASLRSLETQVPVSPLITAQLTGHTPFEEVRTALDRIQRPEVDFNERLHVVAASSMMSHGVDLDRLNTMVMLGVPLATAEFIQATARVGRKRPGLVFVLHKMPLERDASVFRSFRSFVEHGDRFVEPIPITRRSRRVLERTLPGIEMARICQLYEPLSDQPLTIIPRLRHFFNQRGITADSEALAIADLLQLDNELDGGLREDLVSLLRAFFANINDPAVSETFPNKVFAMPVMRSLRDVEEQAPIHD
jgi:hypothetical protein